MQNLIRRHVYIYNILYLNRTTLATVAFFKWYLQFIWSAGLCFLSSMFTAITIACTTRVHSPYWVIYKDKRQRLHHLTGKILKPALTFRGHFSAKSRSANYCAAKLVTSSTNAYYNCSFKCCLYMTLLSSVKTSNKTM